MPPQKRTGSYIAIFIAGLVVGAIVGWGIGGSRSGTSEMTDNSAAMSSTTATSDTGTTANTVDLTGSTIGGSIKGLTVSSTQPSGFAVAISHVAVTEPTWVVVYEDNNGTPGNALGAGLFFPASVGGDTSGSVQLVRATLPGKSYLVGERVDDGDHQYSTKTDKAITDTNGNQMTVEFSAQ